MRGTRIISFVPSGLTGLARATHGLRRGLQPFAASRLALLIVFDLVLASLMLTNGIALAQSSPTEHVFHVTQADVDKALRVLKATSPGRLPTLDGFVAADVPMLEKYQRAYYQYRVETRSTGQGATLLRVSAKVTAWYAGSEGQAGYRELPSNGRLETDLIERLEEALHLDAARVAAPEETDKSVRSTQATDRSVRSTFPKSLPLEQPATRSSLAPPSAQELAQEKRVQQLSEQAMNLEEVLRDQARPGDLAAVRMTGTPVYSKADNSAEVLFRSDAEDEFKVLDESGEWVHVQISGISRGWIHRSALEMPGEMNASAGSGNPQDTTKEVHEETSLFPGDWSPLRGRMVRIRWVQSDAAGVAGGDRWQLARSVFRDAYSGVLRSATKVDGVVIVIDAADGGMIAATTSTLQRWNSGSISDAAFRKECWADPPEALGERAKREDGTKSTNP